MVKLIMKLTQYLCDRKSKEAFKKVEKNFVIDFDFDKNALYPWPFVLARKAMIPSIVFDGSFHTLIKACFQNKNTLSGCLKKRKKSYFPVSCFNSISMLPVLNNTWKRSNHHEMFCWQAALEYFTHNRVSFKVKKFQLVGPLLS